MSSLLTLENVLDPKVAIPLASASTYYVYKKYEPSSPLSAALLLGAIPAALTAVLRGSFSSTLTAIPSVFTAYLGLIGAFVVAYRVSPFHPLAKYPGPFMCKVSKGWFAWVNARDRKTYTYVKKLHEKYGEVVRTGPNEISITHKDFTTAILGPKGLPRGPYYDTRRHTAGYSLDGIRDLKEHPHRRRLWARGTNSTAMKYYETLVQDCVDDMVAGFKAKINDTIDISKWMTFMGFDFMARMAFTEDYGLLKNGADKIDLGKMVETSMLDVSWISHVPWIIPFVKLVNGNGKWEAMTALGDIQAERRWQNGSDKRDLFSYPMDEDGLESERPSKELIKVDGQVAIGAGGDTAATTLSHLWYLLLSDPGVMAKLRKEVDEYFPPGEESPMDATVQSNMPYLNACINETLRVFPPVLAGLQRRVEKGSGGRMVGPYFLPEETQVMMWAYTIHRDPRYFSPLPDTFWPERWLHQDKYVTPTGEELSADQINTTRDVFMPFSLGPMVCVGKSIALLEIRAVLCRIIQQFNFESMDKVAFDTWERKLGEVFVTIRGNLPVKVLPRPKDS